MVSQLGADALGLVFYPKSSRYVSIAQASEIAAVIPPFVSVVGLFLDADQGFVQDVLDAVPLDTLQFHGSENAVFCRQFARPYMKALGMKGVQGGDTLVRYAEDYADAKGILVDSHEPGAAGGTGYVFDWTQLPHDYPKPLILAGGLTADNVCRAIETTQVYAVDVSSGVEISPGRKDRVKMAAFMQSVKQGQGRLVA